MLILKKMTSNPSSQPYLVRMSKTQSLKNIQNSPFSLQRLLYLSIGSKGRLTKRLLEEGLVTNEQMQQLKQEMKE